MISRLAVSIIEKNLILRFTRTARWHEKSIPSLGCGLELPALLSETPPAFARGQIVQRRFRLPAGLGQPRKLNKPGYAEIGEELCP